MSIYRGTHKPNTVSHECSTLRGIECALQHSRTLRHRRARSSCCAKMPEENQFREQFILASGSGCIKVYHGGEGMAAGRCGKLPDEGARGERGVKTTGERREEKVGLGHKPSELALPGVLPQQGSPSKCPLTFPGGATKWGQCSHP